MSSSVVVQWLRPGFVPRAVSRVLVKWVNVFPSLWALISLGMHKSVKAHPGVMITSGNLCTVAAQQEPSQQVWSVPSQTT